MTTITWEHILAHGEPELQTDDDVECEFYAHVDGRNVRVTYYASRQLGPSSAWDMVDDDTGDHIASSRVSFAGQSVDLRVDLDMICHLSTDLYDDFDFDSTLYCNTCGGREGDDHSNCGDE